MGPLLGEYFIVLDGAPVPGHPTPKYDLLRGDALMGVGVLLASSPTMKRLVNTVPAGVPVYRTYLARTDGRTGCKLIRKGNPT